MIDFNHKWCIYISRHPKGFFYKGKGKTRDVLAGRYKGSGTYFKAACEFGGLPWEEWTSEVVETFAECDRTLDPKGRDQGEVAAYKAELAFITDLDLCNPFCLNKTRSQFGALTMKRLAKLRARCKDELIAFQKAGVEAARQPRVNARRKASIFNAHRDPAKKQRILDGQRRPEVRKARSDIAKGRTWWHNPVTGESRMLKAGIEPPIGYVHGRVKRRRKSV